MLIGILCYLFTFSGIFWCPLHWPSGIASLYIGQGYTMVPLYIGQKVFSIVPYIGQQVFWSPFTLANGYFMVSLYNGQKVFFFWCPLHWPTSILVFLYIGLRVFCDVPLQCPKAIFRCPLQWPMYTCTVRIFSCHFTLANGYFLVYFVQKWPIFLANYLNLSYLHGR